MYFLYPKRIVHESFYCLKNIEGKGLAKRSLSRSEYNTSSVSLVENTKSEIYKDEGG